MALYLYLAAGGVVGVLSRYQLGVWLTPTHRTGSAFPLATLVINITGSFLLGFLMRFLADIDVSREVRMMLVVGLCGGYTTFSTFSYEMMTLLREGAWGSAFLYTFLSLMGSLLACLAGYALAEFLARR